MPGEFGFRYVYSPSHIENILEKIQQLGRPDKLTHPYVKNTWLLKNDQYSAVLPILRDMQFIDDDGVPLDLYAKYQNPSLAKEALAQGVMNAYPKLFRAYPDAFIMPRENLEGYLKQQTGKSGSVLKKWYLLSLN